MATVPVRSASGLPTRGDGIVRDLRAELKRVGSKTEVSFLDPFLVAYSNLVAQPEALEALAGRLGAVIVSSNRDIAVDVLQYLTNVVAALPIRREGLPSLGAVLMMDREQWAEQYPDIPWNERGLTALIDLLPESPP